jgi:ATP-dependent RNA helicase DDX3X
MTNLEYFLRIGVLTLIDANEDADHCYMMFSATFNKECRQLARKDLASDHVRIRIGRAGSTHINIQQQVSTVQESRLKS